MPPLLTQLPLNRRGDLLRVLPDELRVLALEHHGDYLCIDKDGGTDCRLESSPAGYGRLVKTPLGLEGIALFLLTEKEKLLVLHI